LKRTLFSIMTLMLVVGLVGGGAFAWFSDVATSSVNTFAAGTLDLVVDESPASDNDTFVDNPNFNFTLSDLKPGWTMHQTLQVKNIGTIEGTPSIKLSGIENLENGIGNPELGDPTAGVGELGDNIWVQVKFTDTGDLVYNDFLNGFTNWRVAAGTLKAGEAKDWIIDLSINGDVGNIIQSDSVEFKVVFGLDQTQ
jgi:predicted ribosomally synthesized peptide with SipW-like signal peptide